MNGNVDYVLRQELELHVCEHVGEVGNETVDILFQWVRSISFPRSTPVCPMYFIPGAHPGQPKCPACGMGHLPMLGAGPRCMTSPREGE